MKTQGNKVLLSVIVFFIAFIILASLNDFRSEFIAGSLFWAAIIDAVGLLLFYLVASVRENKQLVTMWRVLTLGIIGSFLINFLFIILFSSYPSLMGTFGLMVISYFGLNFIIPAVIISLIISYFEIRRKLI